MNILDQIRQTVAETLNVPLSSVTTESSSDNIDVWDSLAQVNLMISLEQTFDVVLEVEDFIKLNSVEVITTYIEKNTES